MVIVLVKQYDLCLKTIKAFDYLKAAETTSYDHDAGFAQVFDARSRGN
jgi:hypothetical protein